MGMFSALRGLPLRGSPNIYGHNYNIAVIGGINISRNAAKMANLIGRQTIKSGFNLVTGGRMGAGFEASRGAYEACLKLHIDPNKRIFSVVPKGKKPDFKFGTSIQAGKDKLERRIALIQNTDQALVIGGGQGTMSEIRIGVIEMHMNGYGITAIPGTGGEADRICSIVPPFKDKILNDPAPSEERAKRFVLGAGWHCDIDYNKAHDEWYFEHKTPLAREMSRIRHKYF